jgi:hypothetical protein
MTYASLGTRTATRAVLIESSLFGARAATVVPQVTPHRGPDQTRVQSSLAGTERHHHREARDLAADARRSTRGGRSAATRESDARNHQPPDAHQQRSISSRQTLIRYW